MISNIDINILHFTFYNMISNIDIISNIDMISNIDINILRSKYFLTF